jgi:probable HAF family extracellular repeat protein
MKFVRQIPKSALVLVLPLFWQSTALCQTYTITDLGSNTWSYSEAHGISAGGQVVGEYEPAGFIGVLGFVYDGGVFTDVGHLSGQPYTVAYGINASNQVAGESGTANNTHAFLFQNGSMTDLGTLGANNSNGYSSAHAINGSSQIVGESSIATGQAGTIHAVLYNGNSKTDLGALSGNYSSANAINGVGEIVGESDVVLLGSTNVHAFRYGGQSMTDLGTLGGGYSSAKGVNDSGIIVGESEVVSGGITNLHGFIFRNGSMSDLGTFGGSSSSASAINNRGMVVGYATDQNEQSNAFLYDGTNMLNLASLIPLGSGWTSLSSADAINDAGQIAGSGYLADGSFHGYLLTPIPKLSVTITNPAPNASFQAPATIVIGADTVDTAGRVTNVQFSVNGNDIAGSLQPPYHATASELSPGTYLLGVIASDNTGLKATNSITVQVIAVSDTPPTVSITNPVVNATFQAPATFSIEASAADSDGTVTNVLFLSNSNVLGNSATSPYAATANGLAAGTYLLTAIATDNAGLSVTDSITITVSAPLPDAPPNVTITNPAPNSVFQAPAAFEVEASASDSDGSVTNVQFLVGTMVITNAFTIPFSALVTNLMAGTYTLTAIAVDDAGLKSTNSIQITVNSGAVNLTLLSLPVFNSAGFSFSFPTRSGVSYQGQFSESLGSTNWTTFTNFTGNGAEVQFSDNAPTSGSRLYRVSAQ